MISLLLSLTLLGRLAAGVADDGLDGGTGQDGVSPWYLERGTAPRQAHPLDDVPSVVDDLAGLLRDGRVPGFYDGQFAATVDRFDELARVARDRDMHHTIRIMAVMALQEAADGPRLSEAIAPLLIDPGMEYQIEYEEAQMTWYGQTWGPLEADNVRRQLDADLSRHARFALAKDGQPAAIQERIDVLRQFVDRKRDQILDPLVRTRDSGFLVWHGRQLWFDIAYHYQQFDDYESATEWFTQLCEHLPPGPDTRMARYNLACIAALQGRTNDALRELRAAYDSGFLDVTWMDEDGDLSSLRELPGYQEIRQGMVSGGVEERTNSSSGVPLPESAGDP